LQGTVLSCIKATEREPCQRVYVRFGRDKCKTTVYVEADALDWKIVLLPTLNKAGLWGCWISQNEPSREKWAYLQE